MFDRLRSLILAAADKINVCADPFDEFTRGPDIQDKKSLQEKYREYSDNLRGNYLFGKSGEFYANQFPNDLGDNAIWQGVWVFHEVLSGDSDAAKIAFQGLKKMQYSSPHGRLARGVDRKEGRVTVHDPSRTYFENEDHIWTQQVSESSLLGHLFGIWSIIQFSQDKDMIYKAGKMARDLADVVIEDGYRLRDDDGTHAKYGSLKPSDTTAPIRLVALGCLLLLASWSKVKKNHDYIALYHDLIKNHELSMRRPETHLLWVHPWYQDFLVYISMPILIHMETNLTRAEYWRMALSRQYKKNHKEGNPFYVYMSRFCGIHMPNLQVEKAAQILNEFSPLAKVKGSKEVDPDYGTFHWGPKWLRGGKKYAKQPVAPWARPSADFFWQRDPYSVKGHADHDYNFLDFMVAYQMKRRFL